MKSISSLWFLLFFSIQLIFAQKTEKIYLSGTGYDQTIEWDFYCSDGMNSKIWTTIDVPSCWEQQGFGSYNYGHDRFEDRLNEFGIYRTTFKADKAWKGQEIRICFEGVMTDASIVINGEKTGSHQGAFYAFDFDISDFLIYGKMNELEITVHKHSENKSINQAERKADYWIFGGIFRPVSLEIKPKNNIQRVAIDADANGTFRSNVYLNNVPKGGLVEVEIQELDGRFIHSFSTQAHADLTKIEVKCKNIKPWNPEEPKLYNVIYRLRNSKGKVLHEHTERFGFRTIEVRESDGIYVNNVKVKLKGVCRHSFHSQHGRTTSKQLSIKHVNLLKDMNMNAVRMSHYPPDKHFLDVCDSLGLFVLDELAGWQRPSYDDEIGLKLLKEMIAFDVNHPSVILWDNANEGGENNTLNEVFAQLDIQERKVLHPWQHFEAFNTLHYFDYNYLALDNISKRKLFMPTEFLHGLYDGGHGSGLDDYWKLMWDNPLCTGGFLWVFADEAIQRTDKNGVLDSDGNHAPDGIVGPNLEKEGSFYTIKEIWSPIFIESRYLTPAFNGKFNIENRFHYTQLQQCKLWAEWISVKGMGETAKEVMAFKEDLSIELEPMHKGILELKLPDQWQQYDILKIHATDPHGRHINTWSWPVKLTALQEETPIDSRTENEFQFFENADIISISSGQFAFTFSKTKGTLQEIKKDEKIIPLNNGPVFVSKEKTVKSVSSQIQNQNYSVRVQFENSDWFEWTISKNGSLILDVNYEPQGGKSDFSGITFNYPEDKVSSVKWLGKGPYRVYKNRMKGARFGLWEKAYNNTITGDNTFIYPEFKGYHAEVYWMELRHKNSPDFMVQVQSDDIFVHLFTPEEAAVPSKTKMKYPKGDLSFLHSINPIGTKFKNPGQLGPQSNLGIFNSQKIHGGKLHMRLKFIF